MGALWWYLDFPLSPNGGEGEGELNLFSAPIKYVIEIYALEY
jgi:hypothetical protein